MRSSLTDSCTSSPPAFAQVRVFEFSAADKTLREISSARRSYEVVLSV